MKTEKESEASESCERDIATADYEYMYYDAVRHGNNLEVLLKEKCAEVEMHVKRWQFYESLVKRLTTFN